MNPLSGLANQLAGDSTTEATALLAGDIGLIVVFFVAVALLGSVIGVFAFIMWRARGAR